MYSKNLEQIEFQNTDSYNFEDWNEIIQKIALYIVFLDKHAKYPSYEQSLSYGLILNCILNTGNVHVLDSSRL